MVSGFIVQPKAWIEQPPISRRFIRRRSHPPMLIKQIADAQSALNILRS